MSKYKLGLVNILMGDIAGDGGMGTSLSAVGDTVAGTAAMTTADDTKTDFNIEESDSPVLSIVTTPGKLTLAWSSYNNDVDNLVRMFGGSKVAGVGPKTGTITGKTYTAGTGATSTGNFANVPLTGGTGTGAKATISTANGGGVTAVAISDPGQGYAVNDVLSASSGSIAGVTGFAATVTSVATIPATGDRWNAPDTSQEIEQSIEVDWKQGGKVLIPRAKLSAKLNISFKKDTLSQIDISADILQPTKVGEPRLSIISDTV